MAEENVVLKNTWHSELHRIRHRGLNQLPLCIAQFQTAFLYLYSLRLGQWRSAFAFKTSLFIILILLRTVTNSLEHECNYYLVLIFSSFFLFIHFYAFSYHHIALICPFLSFMLSMYMVTERTNHSYYQSPKLNQAIIMCWFFFSSKSSLVICSV